ncbi:MAG: S-layer homology domain-containing protein [Clostridia bacterium]|nr:S-layer homology domain-containing protein [Clostridia bacterium]
MKKYISILLITAILLSTITGLALPANAAITSPEGRFCFTDVKEGHWYYESVLFCYVNGIVKGMDQKSFDPNGMLTRGQFAVLLASVDGAELTEYQGGYFTDVKPSYWYAQAAEWAYGMGYIFGMEGQRFCANAKLTREQFCTVMYRYMQSKDISVEVDDNVLDGYFDNRDISGWAREGVGYCVSAGLIQSTEISALKVSPKNPMTRAMISRVMCQYFDNYIYAGCEHSFSEADCLAGPACSGCGMVNGLPLGHSCPKLNCAEGSVCTRCGEVVAPDPYFHRFTEPTCTKSSYCTVCGETKGEPKGHSFRSATCTEPKICDVCGTRQGPALGHTTSYGVCSRCKGDIFPTEKDRLIYYLKREGVWMNGYSVYHGYMTGAGGETDFYIMYNNATGQLLLYSENIDNGNYSTMMIDLTKTYDGKYYYEHLYYNYAQDLTCAGVGYVNPATGALNKAKYEGPDYSENWYNGRTEKAYKNLLNRFDYYLWVLCDAEPEDFGFNKVK